MLRINLGCGCHRAHLPEFENSDVGDDMIKAGAKYVNICKTFPYEDNSVDVAMMSHVLCMRACKEHILKEIYRVLKPNGYLRIDDNEQRIWKDHIEIFQWRKFPRELLISQEDLMKMMSKIGFINIQIIDRFTTTIVDTEEAKASIILNHQWHPTCTFTMECQKGTK